MRVAMNTRTDRRTFVRSAPDRRGRGAAGADRGMERRAEGAAGQRGGLAQGVASGEPGERTRSRCGRGSTGSTARATSATRSPATRLRKVVASAQVRGRGRRDFTVHQRVSGRPHARRGVLLPLRHRAADSRRSGASGPRGRPARARPVRIALLLLPGVHRRLLHRPRRPRRSRTSTSSCASATTSTSRRTPTGSRNAPVRTDDAAADGEAQTLAEYRRKYTLYHTDERLLEVRRQSR